MTLESQETKESRILAILEQVRPALGLHGGDLEFVKYVDNIVYIKLTGACVGCPMSAYTLKLGIEEALKSMMPEIKEVVSVDTY